MSDQVTRMLRIPLSELKTIRITCKQCGKAVIEVPTVRADTVIEKGGCRLCRRDVFDQHNDPLNHLRLAFEQLEELKDKLGVEFEIVAPG